MSGFDRDGALRRSPVLTGPYGWFPRRSEGRLLRLFTRLIIWQERARQRHQLASLDDRMLKDIGLDRADVAREASKPFWHA